MDKGNDLLALLEVGVFGRGLGDDSGEVTTEERTFGLLVSIVPSLVTDKTYSEPSLVLPIGRVL